MYLLVERSRRAELRERRAYLIARGEPIPPELFDARAREESEDEKEPEKETSKSQDGEKQSKKEREKEKERWGLCESLSENGLRNKHGIHKWQANFREIEYIEGFM